ncbi:MAG TPA: hypothetical protein VFM91_04425 [Propionibacteriaceae bacterium]|nr:hypothetical protein [Propionibacteriaceae bacterium]
MYEITLCGTPLASLAARFPSVALYPAPVSTVLSRSAVDSLEIDELVDKLRSLGITPREVRGSRDHYEVRIEGRLGDAVLHSLRWAARLEEEQTVMRVSATQGELRVIMEELANSGSRIEHCIRCRGI